MKPKKCQRPDCKRKATVRIHRDTEELWVCQLDVRWAHLTLYEGVVQPKAQEEVSR